MMDPDNLDRISQRMLVLLLDRERLTTSTLRKELGIEKNQKINYRGKRVLGSGRELGDKALELVANSGDGGGNQQELQWWLTDRGETYVEKHRDALERPNTTAEAIVVSSEAKDTADDVEERMGQLEGQFGSLKADVIEAKERAEETSDSVDDRLADIQATINGELQDTVSQAFAELRGEYEELEKEQRQLQGEIERLEADLAMTATRDHVDEQLKEIGEVAARNQRRIDDAEPKLGGLAHDVSSLKAQADDQDEAFRELSAKVDAQGERIDRIEDKLDELQETVESGLFDDFFRD